ncbi:hypothetical protein K0504_02215 [Neiella marina]|uniref:STAS/SEC14 domain-containing protein n=1 Tax=Neiella holothuriorum TaxID=2870530 RepID=A0ABS7EDE8_9GAMM|nr:hypothetical protein [Neiella holothuriorum]MBW8189836.1 hypothetical protein [Neiella holothuriorum]
MRPHGQWHINVTAELIHLTLHDAFNCEGVALLRQELRTKLAQVDVLPKLVLTDIRDSAIVIPDAYLDVEEMHSAMAAMGIEKVAYCCANNWRYGRFLLEPLWQHVPQIKRDYFKDEAAALAWLELSSTHQQSAG